MTRKTQRSGESISVVIPTHNTRELTLDCLLALAAAPAPPEEILVVDDGSEDGTAEAIRAQFPDVHLFRHQTSQGFTAAANAGLQAVSSEISLLLNSDTQIAPTALDALRSAFANRASLGIAGAELVYPDGRPQWSGGEEPSLLWLWALSSGVPSLLTKIPGYRRFRPLWGTSRRKVSWVSGAALAARRAVWDEVGPLDERFRFYAQDLDFCIRAAALGWSVEIVPDFRVLHHHGATIRNASGASRHQHTELLWTDLLLWARKQKSGPWTERARGALSLGAGLRILGRTLWTPCTPRSSRSQWKADNATFRQALAAVRNLP